MSYKLATAFVEIVAKGANQVSQAFAGIQGDLLGLVKQFAGALGAADFFPTSLSELVNSMVSFTEAAVQAEMSVSRLNGVLRATGNAAGFSSKQIQGFADDLMNKTILDDEDILDATSKMLTFKKVTGDTMKQAIELSADLAGTGFGSIQSSALMMGKALEDPIRGINSLRRAGVTFSEEEKKLIKTLVETNRLLEAQEMILKGVRGQVGGVAQELAKTSAGAWQQIKVAIGNVKEWVGAEILPQMVEAARTMLDIVRVIGTAIVVVSKINSWMQWIVAWPKKLADAIRGFIDPIVSRISKLFGPALDRIWDQVLRIGSAMAQTFGNLFKALMNLGGAFLRLVGIDLRGVWDSLLVFGVAVLNKLADMLTDLADRFETIAIMMDNLSKGEFLTSFDEVLRGVKLERELAELMAKRKPMRAPDVGGAKGPIDIKAGFQGFAEASRLMQEAILKSESGPDPQVEIAAGVAAGNAIAQQQLLETKAQTALLADKPKVLS